jgi:hypothetical protein
MARARDLQEMTDEAYRLADAEGDELRHPRADVQRWVNKGLNELYDVLVEARGRDYYRASATIALVSGTVDYSLPADFYKLIGVRRPNGGALVAYDPAQDAELRDGALILGSSPLYYQLRGTVISFLPTPGDGEILLDYVPAFVDLADEAATFDGVSGWEDYASLFAARRMAMKDESFELAGTLGGDLAKLAERIGKLAPKRDAGSPRRVKDVRSQTRHAALRRWR